MKQIMLFDDRPDIRRYLTEGLENRGYNTAPCSSIYKATKTWQNQHDSIDAIIIDIMIDPLGLKELTSLTETGHYSGWIWLWDSIKQSQIETPPFKKTPVLIYSAYIKDLEEFIMKRNSSEEQRYFRSTEKLFKGKDGIDEIHKTLKRVL